ncbi:MAG: NADH-quinone oxidoreductase subunit NuoH [Actinobacteria bacterium]|jgi:NADH-quinone oxidoreductase subunit H|nr:NADH-quinone oxidoreductase subunit NuoH [Actinomycetota bacterium]
MSDPVAQLVFLIVKAVAMPLIIITMVAFAIYFERKFAGFFQARVGPTYLGPWGSLQSFGDVLKLISKEDVIPLRSDKSVFKLAPYIAFVPAFLVMAVLPFGPVGGEPNLFGHRFDYVIANFDAGVVLFLAMGAIAVYGVVLAGWSSNSNYSLLGGLRAGAQMISYELAMGFSAAGVMVMAGSMSLVEIVDGQKGAFWEWYWIPQIVGAIIFFIASIAELNRTPFDMAEAEQELVAGYLTEYSGMRWGMFYLAEYVNMIVVSGIISTLYFGGWRAPFESWNVIPGPIWLFLKICVLIFIYMWIRWTIFRYRYNQLMSVGWKVLLPLSLANLAVTAVVVSVVG